MIKHQKISHRKLAIFFIISAISMLIAWKIQPFIHNNDKAVDLIVNVFSILAGFLIAIMTLFADINIGENENWRSIEIRSQEQNKKYAKNELLFYGYLLVLAFVFISILLPKDDSYGAIVLWTERIYVFLAIISFCYSLFLPVKIKRMQQEKINRLLSERKPKI